MLVTLLPLVGFVLLTAGNAFFVAAEFALVTVDRAEIDRRAAEGDARAATVRRALRELSFQLSGAQLGITITALLTGYLAEPALARLVAPLLRPLGGADRFTGLLALALATLISMLFGELVPKNLALARPMPAALTTAGPMRTFARACGWLIRLLNDSANRLVRRLGWSPRRSWPAPAPRRNWACSRRSRPGPVRCRRTPRCCCAGPSASATSGPPRR